MQFSMLLNSQFVKIALTDICLMVLFISLANLSLAVPADPSNKITVTQPDGMTTLTLRSFGDERNGRLVTEDGYTVVRNSDGWYCYAVLDADGFLTSSGRKAKPLNRMSSADKEFLKQIEPYLAPANLDMYPGLGTFSGSRNKSPIKGCERIVDNVLAILIDFPDESFTYPSADFDNLFNQDGFDGIGSVNDFYWENSYGAYGLYGTVVGWYTAKNNRNYYAYTNGWRVAAELAKEAVEAAKAAGVDFSPFDNDCDGYVDGLFIIHAGPGAEAGFGGYPWSHAWGLNAAGVGTVSANGKIINGYTMEPEKFTHAIMTGIGVFCHEYGHALGIIDLYDTDGSSIGIGRYGLMSGGCWNGPPGGPGKCPAHFCAWSKAKLGWITPINASADLFAETVDDIENNPACYRLWSHGAMGDEYFLLSYRNQVGFDTYLPGCGIAIWHIDDRQRNNRNDLHRRVDLEEADYTEDNSPGDLWLAKSFNNTTYPNSRDYSGNPTYVSVDVISSTCSESITTGLFVGAPTMSEIMIRDCPADIGNEPDAQCVDDWVRSPDIWIDNDGDGIIDPPAPGMINKIHFRAENIGTSPVYDATVRAQFVDPAMGLYFPNPGGTYIIDEYIGGMVFPFRTIMPGDDGKTSINWRIPEPPPSVHHYCIGAMLDASNDPQVNANPLNDNNVAQINMWALYLKAGQVSPIPERINTFEPTREDTVTRFHSIIRACNPFAETTNLFARFDTASLYSLPWQWWPEFVDSGPWLLSPDSCFAMDVYMEAYNAQHNDSVSLTVQLALVDDPQIVIGEVTMAYVIDNYSALPICSLKATALKCQSDFLDSCYSVRLDWEPPDWDEMWEPERVRWYYIYSDSGPGVDSTRILDSVAVDADPELPGFQWYDYRALASEETRFYCVATVDASFSLSELSNVAQVSFAGCDVPGDANHDQNVNVGDAVYLINYIFSGGPPPVFLNEGDANSDCTINVGDPVYLVSYIFKFGPPPQCGCVE